MTPARAATVAGVCGLPDPLLPMALTLGSSNAVLVPGTMSWNVSGSGKCVDTNGVLSLGSGSLNGSLNSVTTVGAAGCAVGALEGTLTFALPSTGSVSGAAKAVHVGAVFVVVITRTPLSFPAPLFTGTGVFVLDPVKTDQTVGGVTACRTASNNVTLHFLGTFAFAASTT